MNDEKFLGFDQSTWLMVAGLILELLRPNTGVILILSCMLNELSGGYKQE